MANLKFQVPIDMADYGLSCPTTATTWENTKVNLNTSDYDGNATYAFEIVYQNADSSTRVISLVNNAGTAVATITVSASISVPTRIRSSNFTPTAGANAYRIKTPITTTGGNLLIFCVRIVITQDTTMTKTRIQIPLTGLPTNSTFAAATALDTTTSGSYGQPNAVRYGRFLFDLSRIGQIATTTPYSLEVSMNTDAATSIKASLFDSTTGNQVTNSEASLVNTAAVTTVVTDFSSDTNLISGDEMELRIFRSAGTGTANILKSSFYIRLNPVYKAQAFWRIGRVQDSTISFDTPHMRALISLSSYLKPQTFNEYVGNFLSSGSFTGEFIDSLTQDSGTGSASSLGTWQPGSSKARHRDVSSLTDGHRIYCKVNATSGEINMTNWMIIIQSEDVQAPVFDSLTISQPLIDVAILQV